MTPLEMAKAVIEAGGDEVVKLKLAQAVIDLNKLIAEGRVLVLDMQTGGKPLEHETVVKWLSATSIERLRE